MVVGGGDPSPVLSPSPLASSRRNLRPSGPHPSFPLGSRFFDRKVSRHSPPAEHVRCCTEGKSERRALSGDFVPRPHGKGMAASILSRALGGLKRPAVSLLDRTYTYEELLATARRVSKNLAANRAKEDECVGILAESGPDYVVATWATWLSGRVAVPLSPSYPNKELGYFVQVRPLSFATFSLPRPGERTWATY